MEKIDIKSNVFLNLLNVGTKLQIKEFLTEFVEKGLSGEIELSLNGVIQYEPELGILKKRLQEKL